MDITTKMNICFLTSEEPNLRSGGIENVTYRLATGFTTHGHNVHCICLDALNNNTSSASFKIISIGRSHDTDHIVIKYLKDNHITILINQSVELRWRYILNSVKQSIPTINIIKVLHTDPAYLIKGVRDGEPLYIKKSNFYRWLYLCSPKTALRRYRRFKYMKSLYRDWLNFYDKIVLLSNNNISDFKHLSKTLNCTKVTAISNPISFHKNNNSNNIKEKKILYVGRLRKEAKRPDRLLLIWEKIHLLYPDWQLIFVGDGPMRADLENYCIKKEITNVIFVGQTDPTPYYKKASILCLTSTYEGFPTVCGEAFDNGVVPIVFNNFGSVRELITDQYTGLLVKPFDLEMYATKLSMLISNPSYTENLRNNITNNDDFISRYSLDVVISKWESLFNSMSETK